MKPGPYMLREDAFIFHKGDIFNLMDGTYAQEICDVCGNRRMCDYLISYSRDKYGCRSFLDCCRSCQKEYLEPCEEPESIEDDLRSIETIGAILEDYDRRCGL